ncbi:hypothetical protein ES703_106065 [subsurface metagenome]
MKLKRLMVIKAIVCIGFGIGLLAIPGTLMSLYGVVLGAGGIFMTRLYGAALCGNLLLTWFARNATDSDARQAIILDLLVYDAIGLVVALIFQLSGGMNILGWSIVAIYLFFTLGYGYFYLAKPVST